MLPEPRTVADEEDDAPPELRMAADEPLEPRSAPDERTPPDEVVDVRVEVDVAPRLCAERLNGSAIPIAIANKIFMQVFIVVLF